MKTTRILTAVIMALLIAGIAAAFAEETIYQPVDQPVIYLHIDGGQAEIDQMNESPDHSYRCTGTMDIAVPEEYGGDFNGRYPQENVQGLKLDYIRGRGNGSWGMSKHPYRIKLEEKTDLFGMGANKNWALVANYFDNSLIRNRITYWLGEKMGLEFTPEGTFVEVVMNGEYLGSYYLCEQVRTGKNRVAIEELKEEDTALPDIQGGYLLEFFPDDEGPDMFETGHLILGNQTPSFNPEDDGYENDAQKEYIRDYIRRAEDAIYAEDGNYADYLDLESLADYWWIMEFSANGDAFRTDSAHMFKKRFEADGSEGKLHFGPLWDFDDAWGCAQVETQQVAGFNNTFFAWTEELRTKPEFRAILIERWQVMDEKLEELVREGGVLDRMAALMKDAWYRDNEKWQACHLEDGTDVGRSFEEEIEHLRGWINLRREWINANMDRIGMTNCTLSVRGEGVEEESFKVNCDDYISLYDIWDLIPADKTDSFAGWALEDGTIVEDFLWVDRDITLTAVYND